PGRNELSLRGRDVRSRRGGAAVSPCIAVAHSDAEECPMTPRQQLRPRVSGAALVTALVLLLVLSVLAVAGVGMAVAELSMAGNEQFRRQAADAASAGIEVVVARLMATPEGSAADGSADSIPLEDSAAQVSTVLRFAGYEAVPPRWSVNKLQARHYVIESTGRAPR